jgi:hypothetical protein
MPAKNIVIGQRVDPTKVERSKNFAGMTPEASCANNSGATN